ncbi:MAG: GNAT family N-acetyltransferase [Thaumarchaeota archaeon]|nr:MAG: GNAT family N-acetyltransferase [Nitrososphaerota archaeon]TLX86804.1 MAG: GNAT family N-acetyltransferase [Nitrososphaerota archaeon]
MCRIDQKKVYFDKAVLQYITVNIMTEEKPSRLKLPKIKGLLVDLRELSINDAVDISRLMTYNISKSLWQVPYPYNVENAVNFINSCHRNFESLKAVNFAIQYKNNLGDVNRLVGIVSLKNIDSDNKKANVGYWIGEQYWGNGLATESVALVINYAFSVLGLEEISAYVYSENKASIRVLERNGMTKKEEVNEYNQISGRSKNIIKFAIQRRYKMDKLKF